MSGSTVVTTVLAVREYIKRMIERDYGSLTEYARSSTVSVQYVSNVIAGVKPIPTWMLDDFGVEHVVEELWIIPLADTQSSEPVSESNHPTDVHSQTLFARRPKKIVALAWDDEPVIRIDHKLGGDAEFILAAFVQWTRRTIRIYICPSVTREHLVLWMREMPKGRKDIDPTDDHDLEFGTKKFDIRLAYCSADSIPLACSAFWMIVEVLRSHDEYPNDLQRAEFRRAGLLTSDDFKFANMVARSRGL